MSFPNPNCVSGLEVIMKNRSDARKADVLTDAERKEWKDIDDSYVPRVGDWVDNGNGWITKILNMEKDSCLINNGGRNVLVDVFIQFKRYFREDGVLEKHIITDAKQAISAECDYIKVFLLEKNKNYGNSALEPIRCLSKADTSEQLKVRFDDKLSRLMRGESAGEDTILDMIGYLILLRVQMKREVKGA